jgi:class 3 adenylate cyclase/carbon monoxide dehydrogenase subunit G
MGRRQLTLESRYDRPPEEVWPIVSDTDRSNEVTEGMQLYTVEDVQQADGSVVRHARGRLGPLRVEWEEGFGEWVENSYMHQIRRYKSGPARSLALVVRLAEDGAGTRVRWEFDLIWDSLLGTIMDRLGMWDGVPKMVVRTADLRVAALDRPGAEPAAEPAKLDGVQRQRLDAGIDEIERGPYGHGLAERLSDYLIAAPLVDLKRIRPLALARAWGEAAGAVVELCVAAQAAGLLDMRWAVLCPRCRVAKSQVSSLYELPRGVHCESCNIDYDRDFSANVELVFHPAGWLREVPEGDYCMMGAASAPHVKVQREVEPGGAITVPLKLPAGSYRLRTVEAGGQCDVQHDGGAFPEIVALGEGVEAGPPAEPGQVTMRNAGDRPLSLVLEARAWTTDALTGPQVISMPAFRELCPEQVLRPGDDVVIGQVAIMFSDLKGSTALYAEIGDSAAYSLVRDHFAFFAERVRSHKGILVKTMGDAVMAAFDEPADAVRAALTVQRDVAKFNAEHQTNAVVVKLGLHRGECIAVNTAGTLDYFGTAVNVAARLQGESLGNDIVLSGAIADDPAVAQVLADAEMQRETALLHGLSEAVTFYRLPTADRQ